MVNGAKIADGSADLVLPQMVAGAVAVWPVRTSEREWKVEVDVESVGVGFLCRGQGKFLGLLPCSGESALWPKGMGVDLAYQEWFYEPYRVTGNMNPTVNGTYHAFVHLGTFSFRYLF